jgi:quercetin dioxygenase-like cupin family protein
MTTREPNTQQLRVIRPTDWEEELPLIRGQGVYNVIVGPSAGASERSMNLIQLEASAQTVPLRHPGEAVYYVIKGSVEAHDHEAQVRHALTEGSMIHIDAGTQYSLHARGSATILGGPAPLDPALYARTAVEHTSEEQAL